MFNRDYIPNTPEKFSRSKKIEVPLPSTPSRMSPLATRTQKEKRNLFKRYCFVLIKPSKILEAEKDYASWGGIFRNLLIGIAIPIAVLNILFMQLLLRFVNEEIRKTFSPLLFKLLPFITGITAGIIWFLIFSALFFLGQMLLFGISRLFKGEGDFKTQAYLISFCAVPIFFSILFLVLTFFISAVVGRWMFLIIGLGTIALVVCAFISVIKAIKITHGYSDSEAISSLIVANNIGGIILWIIVLLVALLKLAIK